MCPGLTITRGLTEVVIVSHPIVWLVQVQVVHYALSVRFLRINDFLEERILCVQTINDIPRFRFSFVTESGVRYTLTP